MEGTERPARALILAAGEARRMGRVKALLPLPCPAEGKKIEAQSALALLVGTFRRAGITDITVVTGWHAHVVEPAAKALGLAVARNPAPERGMFSSVQTGLQALLAAHGQGPVLVNPVDVPLVRSLTLRALLEAAAQTPDTVLLPVFAGQEGHPPCIPAAALPALAAYAGPDGLRGALAALPCRRLSVPDAAMLEDMDRPEDYARLQRLALRRAALSPAEALELLRLRAVPEKGLRHARAVGAVARALAEALGRAARMAANPAQTAVPRAPGAAQTPALDPELACAGGLVHDIAKGQPHHEAAGAALLEALDLPHLAALVRDHRDLSLPDDQPVSERELVYLADKYCWGGQFVPVAQRFGQKLEVFAQDAEACAAIVGRLGRAKALEARLARELGRAPAAVAQQTLALEDRPQDTTPAKTSPADKPEADKMPTEGPQADMPHTGKAQTNPADRTTAKGTSAAATGRGASPKAPA